MVTLNRIYTRGGDKGRTSLGSGKRVAKHALRVEAYGTVDEANAILGVARLHSVALPEVDTMLSRIQNDLFDLGADLCVPEEPGSEASGGLRIIAGQVTRLEQEIDRMNDTLGPLTSFILPGGSPLAAHLHVARTTVRRAERLVSHLKTREVVNEQALMYLNRLSDHLFVLSRFVNGDAGGDVLWVPGATRG